MNKAPLAHSWATDFLDIEHESVRAFTAAAVGDAGTDRDKAKRLFAAVRDQIRYDPYTVSDDPAHYRASFVLETGRAYCVPKAVLLTAVCRAAGIPALLGFAAIHCANCARGFCFRNRRAYLGGERPAQSPLTLEGRSEWHCN